MFGILFDSLKTASRQDRWSPPPHWKESSHGPVSTRRAAERHQRDMRRAMDQTGLR